MPFDHTGRVAFVTGAGGGIGRATCLRLAAEGAAVVVTDVAGAAADETAAAVRHAGGTALAARMDVRDRGAIADARQAALDRFGALHYLVNNAGLVTRADFRGCTDEEWDLVVGVNLTGPWRVAQEIAPAIAAAGGGAVVNLSTIEAEVVVSSTGSAQPHYNASKGGVRMLTKAMAVELARDGIRVNAVAPGPVATDFFDYAAVTDPDFAASTGRLLIPRAARPEEVAAAISFLLSDEASFITGAQLPVDGGWLTR